MGMFNFSLLHAQTTPPEKFQQILNQSVDQKQIFGTTVSIQYGNESWSGSAGNLQNNDTYFIASTTKLYITALIMQLRSEGKLQLSDKINRYLPAAIMENLHVYKGSNYSDSITIQHLLAHTSGLPDYFQGKQTNGKSLLNSLTDGEDQHWTFEQSIELSKTMQPKFIPGTSGKALYSDTNYQLLGKILEIIYGANIDVILTTKIFQPLGLHATYLYVNKSDTTPAVMYYKKNELPIPMAMTSFGPDGGIVSTSSESLIFLKAFFNGTFFPVSYLTEMYQWNKVMFPLEYGIGLMRFKLPAIFTLGANIPPMYGHSGLSGAFAFYCPEKDCYITGTVNQIHKPGSSFKLMVKLLQQVPE